MQDLHGVPSQVSQENVVTTSFVDRKDNVDSYLLQFERYTNTEGWKEPPEPLGQAHCFHIKHRASLPNCQIRTLQIIIVYRKLYCKKIVMDQS